MADTTILVYSQDGTKIPLKVRQNADGTYSYQAEPPFAPVGAHQADTTIDTAQALTIPPTATKVWLQAEAQDIRYTTDGTTTPTASVGFLLAAGDERIVDLAGGIVVQVIGAVTGAVLQYQPGK